MGAFRVLGPKSTALVVMLSLGLSVMPHVIAIAAGAAISLYYAVRWVRRESDRVEEALKRTDRRIRRPSKPATTLAFDAATGVYRPLD